MPYPSFSGSVDISICCNTPYDIINVPIVSQMIYEEAGHKLDTTGYMVWQTQYLSSIKVNIDNYNDIQGAQYIVIYDNKNDDVFEYWYQVLAFKMVSNKTVEFTLQYDPLLTLNLADITGVTGFMKRWSVGDDNPLLWINTPEPINRASDYVYSYTRLRGHIAEQLQFNSITGFPYNMAADGTVTTYFPVGEGLDPKTYAIPKFSNTTPTEFGLIDNFISINSFEDGLKYFVWKNNDIVKSNYSAAIGYGMDIGGVGYSLPLSPLISYNPQDGNAGYNSITGNVGHYDTDHVLEKTGYNNRKAGEMGLMFTLYNEFTGDSVTVQNYDIAPYNKLSVDVLCNPYITGCFMARIHGYMDDENGNTGLVRSCGWAPVSLQSGVGAGQLMNDFNLKAAQDVITTSTNMANAGANLSYQYATDNYYNNTLLNGLDSFLSTMGNLFTGNVGGAVSSFTNFITGDIRPRTAYEYAGQEYLLTMQKNEAMKQLQMNKLAFQGNINSAQPPAIKYAQAAAYYGTAYDFCIRETSLSSFDRLRADVFFTAYGYNVDSYLLSSFNFLRTRERFTFIQADDVRIIDTLRPNLLQKIMDYQAVQYIQDRFSAGLRIWMKRPDYDYSTPNPIRAGYTPIAPDLWEPDIPNVVDPTPVEPFPDPSTNAQRIINTALAEEGVTETGINNVKYNTEFYGREVNGSQYAWCAVFVWWVFAHSGLSELYCGGAKQASCTEARKYYERRNMNIDPHNARPGDLIFFNFGGDDWSISSHIGICVKNNGNSLQTIEGNTSNNKVEMKTRYFSTINGAARPYKD